MMLFFLFKQKTAYEMRISDWSSDVCSSDLGVGGHDQDDVAEVDRLAVVVGHLAVVHDLKQDIEQVGMRLLDLVEQQHAVRMLIDRVGEEPALVEADVARRRADQPRYRVEIGRAHV